MYDIRHRLIWAISGFVSAVSLLVLVTLAGYGLVKAILLSVLIFALVALILWILWVSEPESLVDILAPPPPELPRPSDEAPIPAQPGRAVVGEAGDPVQPREAEEPQPPATCRHPGGRAKASTRGDRRTTPRRAKADKPVLPEVEEAAEVPDADDLLRISGIDPQAGAVLERLGFTRFTQLAELGAEDIARIEAALSAPGRVAAQDWQAQARALIAQGNER